MSDDGTTPQPASVGPQGLVPRRPRPRDAGTPSGAGPHGSASPSEPSVTRRPSARGAPRDREITGLRERVEHLARLVETTAVDHDARLVTLEQSVPAPALLDRLEQLGQAVADLARRVEDLEADRGPASAEEPSRPPPRGAPAPASEGPDRLVELLLEVEGVGEVGARSLAAAFGDRPTLCDGRIEDVAAAGALPEAVARNVLAVARAEFIESLLEVEGVGRARAEALAEGFGRVERLAAASPAEVVASTGVGGAVAQRVLDHVRA